MTVLITIDVVGSHRKAVVKVPRQETKILLSGESHVFALDDCSDTAISVVEHPTTESGFSSSTGEVPVDADFEEVEPEENEIFDADLNGEDDGVSKTPSAEGTAA